MNPTRSALIVLVSMMLVTGCPRILRPDDVTLRWNPNEEKDLAGYKLFYGTEPDRYTVKIDVGRHTAYTVEGLTGGVAYFFALKAYDFAGGYSDYSDELSYELEQGWHGRASKAALGSADNALPKRLALHHNYPNPFNPTTTIVYDIPGTPGVKEHVGLAIYDLRGRLVRRLVDSELEPGRYRIVWDGRTETGERIPSGIFLCRLNFKEQSLTKKITAVK